MFGIDVHQVGGGVGIDHDRLALALACPLRRARWHSSARTPPRRNRETLPWHKRCRRVCRSSSRQSGPARIAPGRRQLRALLVRRPHHSGHRHAYAGEKHRVGAAQPIEQRDDGQTGQRAARQIGGIERRDMFGLARKHDREFQSSNKEGNCRSQVNRGESEEIRFRNFQRNRNTQHDHQHHRHDQSVDRTKPRDQGAGLEPRQPVLFAGARIRPLRRVRARQSKWQEMQSGKRARQKTDGSAPVQAAMRQSCIARCRTAWRDPEFGLCCWLGSGGMSHSLRRFAGNATSLTEECQFVASCSRRYQRVLRMPRPANGHWIHSFPGSLARWPARRCARAKARRWLCPAVGKLRRLAMKLDRGPASGLAGDFDVPPAHAMVPSGAESFHAPLPWRRSGRRNARSDWPWSRNSVFRLRCNTRWRKRSPWRARACAMRGTSAMSMPVPTIMSNYVSTAVGTWSCRLRARRLSSESAGLMHSRVRTVCRISIRSPRPVPLLQR